MGIKVLVTGSTGMVGKGVLLEALEEQAIEQVILLNRNSISIQHPKIKEIVLKDFTNVSSVKNEIGIIDACFHCMGVSSLGMNEEQFHALTFDITKALADTCYELNPDMVFNYVSGTGTDSSERGKVMWARVKGKTENYLLSKGFKKSYQFRAGAIIPEKGVKSSTTWYNALYVILRPLFPLMKKMKGITTSTMLGRAMINSINAPQQTPVHLENQDINVLAK